MNTALIENIIMVSKVNMHYKVLLEEAKAELAELKPNSVGTQHYSMCKSLGVVRASVIEEECTEAELAKMSSERLNKLYWSIVAENTSLRFEEEYYEMKIDKINGID